MMEIIAIHEIITDVKTMAIIALFPEELLPIIVIVTILALVIISRVLEVPGNLHENATLQDNLPCKQETI